MTDPSKYNQTERYDALMDVVRNRLTNRAFDETYTIPMEHYDLILEAARHGPSGANAQPWNYIVITKPELKQKLADAFVLEQNHRAKLGMKFPTPNYRGMATAPGLILVAADFRFIKAFPVLNDGSELDQKYKVNAERILLQSVAASVMSAHLAAAALGYAVWWVTAIGQQEIQEQFKPLIGLPDELAIIDIMCFGPPKKASYKRWRRELHEIASYDSFNMENFWSDEMIDDWIKNKRHRVMYRDADNVD